MAKITDPIPEEGFSSTARRVLLVYPDGTPVAQLTNYESKTFSIGASITDYNVKTSQTMFNPVVTARKTTIKNNDSTNAITFKLNASSNAAISLAANQSAVITDFAVTNVFVTTIGGHTGTTEVIIFG